MLGIVSDPGWVSDVAIAVAAGMLLHDLALFLVQRARRLLR